MNRTAIIILALIFCFSISSAQAVSLDEFIRADNIKVRVIRDKTPFDDKVDAQWERLLLTPKEAGEGASPPYDYFRVQEFLNVARPTDSQPFRIGVHEGRREVYHNLGIQYHNLKYLIEPVFDFITEDKEYIFRFIVKKGYGDGPLEKCYETPVEQALTLSPPSGAWMVRLHSVDADPTGEMFRSCGLRFHVYNYRRQAWADYIEIESIEFSRSEVLRFLQEFILSEPADNALKQYAQQILSPSASPQQPSAPSTGPLDTDNDGDGYSENQGDCDDTDRFISPRAQEICDDGVDNDCDGMVDGADPDCSTQPSTQTFTLRFFYDEVERDEQGKTDYEMVRDNVVATWEGRDLSVLPEEEAHEIVYVSRLSDYFEMRESNVSGPLLSCSANSDFWGDTIEGTRIYYIIECENVRFNQDYVWVFKYKGTDGSVHESVVNIRVNGNGVIEWL